MAIKTYRPITPTLRFQTSLVNDDLTTDKPHKPLLTVRKRTGGRRNTGDLTIRHHGGGHKQKIAPDRFQAREVRRAGQGGDHRVRSQPLGAHRAGALCGRREALHPAAGRAEGWARR